MSAKAKRFLALMFFLTSMLALACGFTLIYVAQELIYAIVMMFVFAAACFITGCVLYAKNKDVIDPIDEKEEKPVVVPYISKPSKHSYDDEEFEDEYDDDLDEEERRRQEEEEEEDDYEEYEMYEDDKL